MTKQKTGTDIMRDELGAPKIVDRNTFQVELDALRVREKAHTGRRRHCSRPPTAPHGRGGWCDTAHWRTREGNTVGCGSCTEEMR
jgi:hypothetical protein